MNIIINGFQDERTFRIIIKLSSVIKIKNFIYTYNYYKPHSSLLKAKGVFLNWRKINFFGDYDTDFNKLVPLDEDIVVSMRGCEAMVLRMMDRLETYKEYSYQERKELYLKHLRYWNDVLTKKKFNLFLTSNVPHETSDFVCYSLCKYYKIPTIILCQTHIPDTSLVFDDWETSDYGLKNEIKKIISQRPKDIKLSQRFEDYYQLQVNPDGNITPFYMKDDSLPRRFSKKIRDVLLKIKKNPASYFKEARLITKALIRHQIITVRSNKLMKYYEKNCTKYEPDQKYIYVALHFQPEMSTSPRADAYVDQALMVHLLSASAPKGVKILVKEHPRQRALARSKEYYNSIMSLSNVELISRKVDSKKLISNCMAVATCVGLVGFESLFRGKPLLMFGHDFFEHFQGSFSIRTKADLDDAIKKIMQGPVFNAKDFRIFLKALDNVCVHGTIDSDYMPTSNINKSENTANFTDAIINKLKSD